MARIKKFVIDLDGTLAQYDDWEGLFHLGDPIPGAVAFTKRLAADGSKIIIFTRRMHYIDNDLFTEQKQQEIHDFIADWLNKHGFAWDEIYQGQGKPDGTAFIDDRGVSCRPQDNPDAYEEAINYIRYNILRKGATL